MLKNKGFTLIELLVVIAIIGVLSAIVLNSLKNSRDKAGDAAVKADVSHLRTSAEIYYSDHSNSYDNQTFTPDCGGTCGGAACTGMFSDSKVQAQIDDSISKSGQTAATAAKCASGGTWYVVAVQLKSSSAAGWCVDNVGSSVSVPDWTKFANGDQTCAQANQ